MEVNKLKELFYLWETKSLQYDYDESQAVIEKNALFKQIKRWLNAYLEFLDTKKEGMPAKIKKEFEQWKQNKIPQLNETDYTAYLRYLDNSMICFTKIAFMLGILKFHKEGQYMEVFDESEEAIIGIKKIKEK